MMTHVLEKSLTSNYLWKRSSKVHLSKLTDKMVSIDSALSKHYDAHDPHCVVTNQIQTPTDLRGRVATPGLHHI